jgi:hypothetical protein
LRDERKRKEEEERRGEEKRKEEGEEEFYARRTKGEEEEAERTIGRETRRGEVEGKGFMPVTIFIYFLEKEFPCCLIYAPTGCP